MDNTNNDEIVENTNNEEIIENIEINNGSELFVMKSKDDTPDLYNKDLIIKIRNN